MPIVSYKFTENPQIDGRINVNASFKDHLGEEHFQYFNLAGGTNVDSYVSAYAFALQTQLSDEESNRYVRDAMEGNLRDTAKVAPKHATKAKIDADVLKAMLSAPIEYGWLNSIDYISALKPQDLSDALGVTLAQAADIQNRINGLKIARDLLKQYQPMSFD